MKYLVLLVLVSGCGFNGDQKLSTNDSNQNINVNFTFINQLIALCKQKTLPELYSTQELYDQAVATCVFNTLSVGAPSLANNPLCAQDADLTGFSTDQRSQIEAICKSFGG